MTEPRRHLGKRPFQRDERDLKLADYLIRDDATDTLPVPPTTFGLDAVFPRTGWGMMGNDEAGDCAPAALCHTFEVLTARGEGAALFTTANALALYSAVTGYDPNAGPPGQNPTDQGTYPRDMLKYVAAHGFADSAGKLHGKGMAYLAVDYTNDLERRQALYIFEHLLRGIDCRRNFMAQFDQGVEITYQPSSPSLGGHAIAEFSVQGENTVKDVTWGELAVIAQAYMAHWCDECWVVLPADMLNSKGESYRGLDLATLRADLAAL